MDDVPLSPFLIWLLRGSWQASLLILLVLVVQRLFRRQLSPKWRYRLWMVVLVRLVLPFSPPSPVSIFNLVQLCSSKISRPYQTTSGPVPVQREIAVREPATHVATGQRPANLKSPGGSYTATQFTMMGLADYAVASQCVIILLLVIWPAGVVLLASKILKNNLRFAACLRQTPAVTNPAALFAMENCRQLLGVRSALELVETREVETPALYGLMRPRLLLPAGMINALCDRELRHVLMHELAHLKRRDLAADWLMTGLEILHWFNPVIRLGFAQMRADREMACDAMVLSHAPRDESERYGATIIKLLEDFVCPARPASGIVGIFNGKTQMKRRIAMIANFHKAPRWTAWAAGLLVVLAMISFTDAKTEPALEPMPPGLVAWWRADGNIEDALGGTPGQAEGHLGFKSGKLGQAFDFDGHDAAVRIPASSLLDVGPGPGLTIDAWIKPVDVLDDHALIEWSFGSAGVHLWISSLNTGAPGTLYANIRDTQFHSHTICSGNGLIKPNKFQHIAVTYDKSTEAVALYFNGELVAMAAVGNFTPMTKGDLHFGVRRLDQSGASIQFYEGQMDEVHLFNRALSLFEIRSLYHFGVRGKAPDLRP